MHSLTRFRHDFSDAFPLISLAVRTFSDFLPQLYVLRTISPARWFWQNNCGVILAQSVLRERPAVSFRAIREGVVNARRCDSPSWFRFSLPLAVLAFVVSLTLAAAPSARAQDAVEYGGGVGMSAGVATSQPSVFSPSPAAAPNSSLFLAKPVGPPPQQLNREWFAKQAGKTGAKLTIDAVPPQSRVWIDGKFVGEAPLTLTLPAGKHHLSLMGPRQEHADQDIEIASGKPRHLEIHLTETYPNAVAITVFGTQKR